MPQNPINVNYQLSHDNNPILLTVHIGYGQTSIMVDSQGNFIFGSSAVYINNLLKKIDVINNLNLGVAQSLRGQKITVITTVLDIQPATNETSVSYTFSGGLNNETFTSKDTVTQDWGAVIHRADIILN